MSVREIKTCVSHVPDVYLFIVELKLDNISAASAIVTCHPAPCPHNLTLPIPTNLSQHHSVDNMFLLESITATSREASPP